MRWALAIVFAASAAWARPVDVEVKGLRLDPETGAPVVLLGEKKAPESGTEPRQLVIWIGPFEAQAIALEMRGVPPPRPLTHDLMKELIERLGAKLTSAVIDDVRENTYFAKLHLETPGGRTLTIDARPSDAIALALRLHGAIRVSEELFASAAAGRPAPARLWGLTLQDLTPEIAELIAVPGARGVLVSDVAQLAPAREVLRGDIIVALDGEPVVSVAELTTRAGNRTATEPVHLSVRREGRELEVHFVAQ